MDFKITIRCEKCSCSFELRPSAFVDKDNLHCVNCGRMLNQEVFSHLKTGVIELAEVPDVVPKGASVLPFGDGQIPEFYLGIKPDNVTFD